MYKVRSSFYTADESTYAQIAAISQPGWLIVVPDEESAGDVRKMIRLFGGTPLRDRVEADPLVDVRDARMRSVEVRTVREIEQMDANERQMMEVL